MAKSKSKDREAQTVVGGVTPSLLKKTIQDVDQLKAELSELQGDLGSTVKRFEDNGGNKPAMNMTRKLKSMETNKAKDFWNCLIEYMKSEGVFAQHELFETEDIGPTKAGKKAAEPKEDTGHAQAKAFGAAHAH